MARSSSASSSASKTPGGSSPHQGNPEQRLRIIHVAGTNGKGSVCAMMDSIFRAAGLRSGLYTSPHLCDLRERIRVDGEMISREAAAEALTELHNFCKDWDHSPTYFELTTALALGHFAEERCDVVILETGMGGRLDATNAVTPTVSVVAPDRDGPLSVAGQYRSRKSPEKAGIVEHPVSRSFRPRKSRKQPACYNPKPPNAGVI